MFNSVYRWVVGKKNQPCVNGGLLLRVPFLRLVRETNRRTEVHLMVHPMFNHAK